MKKIVVTLVSLLPLLLAFFPFTVSSHSSKSNYEVENSGLMDSPWPMFRKDVHHTGKSPYGEEGCTALLKWKTKIGGVFLAHPVIDKDGIIYTGSGQLYAIYPNGTIKWTLDISVFGIAIARDGTIYVAADRENYLYAVNPDGSIKWRCKLKGLPSADPLVGEDGIIYLGTIDWSSRGRFYAISPNGTIRWSIDLDGCSSPVIYNNIIYTDCSGDGYLYAIYASNGTIKWREWEGAFHTSFGPSVDEEGTVYYGSRNGYLYAFYPNGTLKWKYNIGGTYMPPVILENGTLYIASGSKIYAFNRNGTLLWKCKARTANNLAVDKNGIIYGVGGHSVFALNPNGTLRWVWKTNEPLLDGPAIGEDGTIYVVGENNLYAIEPRDAADLRISAIYVGPTLGGIKIKVKNVGKYTAHNVECTAKMDMFNFVTGWYIYKKYTTTVPEIHPGEEVEVKIGKIFLFDPMFFLWECDLNEIRVEAKNANHDIFLENMIWPITVIGPLVLMYGIDSLNPHNWKWEPTW